MMVPFRYLRLLWILALACACACSTGKEKTRGQLMLAITTDLQPPKDFDRIRVQLLSFGSIQFDNEYRIGKDSLTLPATLGLLAGNDPSEPVTIRVTASLGQKVRMVREVLTTVPQHRVARLTVPIEWLCLDRVEITDDGSAVSSCGDGHTCVGGECVTTEVDSSDLADYSTESVFGGGDGSGSGSCFDTVGCFSSGYGADVDLEACTVALDASTESNQLSVALVRPPESEGICGPEACLIPLDGDVGTDAGGWSEKDGKLELPEAVCERLKAGDILGVAVTAACQPKISNLPTCGDWSSVSTEPGNFDADAPEMPGGGGATGSSGQAGDGGDAGNGVSGQAGQAEAGGNAGAIGSAGAQASGGNGVSGQAGQAEAGGGSEAGSSGSSSVGGSSALAGSSSIGGEAGAQASGGSEAAGAGASGAVELGLVAYYPFNDNAKDESGNGHDATVYGATIALDRFGYAGRSYSFSGGSNRIIVAGVQSAFAFSEAFSVVAWFATSASTGAIVTKWQGGTTGDWFLSFQGDNPEKVDFEIKSGTDAWGQALSSANYDDGAWHLAAAVFGGGNCALYMDGALSSISTSPSSVNNDIDQITIGNESAMLWGFVGEIDDVRIYDRALTDQEVVELYHEGGWTGP